MGAFDSLSDDDPIVIKHERRKRMNNYNFLQDYNTKKLEAENARLRAELDALKPSIAGHTPNSDFTIEDLRKEVERLRAENEALKPKPVTELRYTRATLREIGQGYCVEHDEDFDNLKLTFVDGVLRSAEVING